MMSAPALRHASMPAWNAAASPLLRRSRTRWSTPQRARHVRGPVARPVVDDQHLDRVDAGNRRGRSASVAGSVAASFRHGIWMISFT